MHPVFDERDQAIKDRRIAKWNLRPGPRVGDYLEYPDGSLRRFTHDWGDAIQVTNKYYPEHGSFYFAGPYCSYSGGLDPAINKSRLVYSGRTREASVWFFHHDVAAAHNGITTSIPCRVYRLLPSPHPEEITDDKRP